MAWNQPGNSNNNPWGKKPSSGGDLDQAFKDWQKRVESLFGGGRSSTPLMIFLILVLLIWAATGLYTIAPGSQGVVQRFGAYHVTVPNGWGWRFPWPIESVTKVDTSGVKAASYKSRVLTAEPNMVEIEVAVQYRVKQAQDYLFKVEDPEKTLGQVSESAIREAVGRNDLQATLKSGRPKISAEALEIMQRTLDQYGAGIEVRSVNIQDVQVPEAVQQAQRDSVKAGADRERVIKEAQAYANGILPQAEGQAARQVQEAEAAKAQIVQLATGDTARFNQMLSAYEKAPNVTRERMYIEAVESVLRTSRKVIIDSKNSNGNLLYLPLDKLSERGRETDSNTGTMRPSVTVEPDNSPLTDSSRQRVER
ncbi:MAG TPA: FtsH protease activity modulator HflK [Steroidobacteraceae bacterium]|nr:FtsH protease activity modulator HflK [Steroidobacteraceae bacterium]